MSVLADTTVHGTVKMQDGITDAGAGVVVNVTCDNGNLTSETSTTDSNSEYAVTFSSTACGLGDTVFASVPGDEQQRIVKSSDLTLDDLYLLNIELAIPEFSAIAASLAFAGAGLGYLFVRKGRLA